MRDAGVSEAVDDDLKQTATGTVKKVSDKMAQLRVADAITEIFALFKRCNKYIDETMPWALAKDETRQERLATVLYNLVEGICMGATLLEPFMPETAEKILNQLNAAKREYDQLDTFGVYENGTKVTEQPEILFARLDMEAVLAKVAELHPCLLYTSRNEVDPGSRVSGGCPPGNRTGNNAGGIVKDDISAAKKMQ